MTSLEPPVIERRAVALQSVANLVMRVLGVVLGLVAAALLSRGLGPAGYGEFALVLSLSSLLSQLADFGFSQTSVKEMARRPERADAIAAATTLLRATLGLLGAIVVVAYAVVSANGLDPALVLIAALIVPFAAISTVTGLLQAELRIGVHATLTLAKSVAWTLVVVLLMNVGAEPPVVLIAMFIIEQATVLVTGWIAVRGRRYSPSGWRAEVVPMAKASVGLGMIGAGTTVYYRADSILVFRYGGAEEAGFYAAAYRFIDVAQLVPSVLVLPLLPLIARSLSEAELDQARRLGSQAVIVSLAFGIPFAVSLPFLSERLVLLIYGQEFSPSAQLASILGVAFVFISVGWIGMTILIATSGTGRLWILTWFLAAASIASGVLLIPDYGALAAAWTTVAVEMVMGVTVATIGLRRLRARVPFRAAGSIVLLAALTGVTQYLLRGADLFIALLGGGVVYVAMVLGLGLIPLSVFKRPGAGLQPR